MLLAILFDDYQYFAFSELEVGHGYADLCLIVRPELRNPKRFDLLFELKLVRKKDLNQTAEALKDMPEVKLRTLPAVKSALEKAKTQTLRYAQALKARFGDVLNLRCFVVVAVDLERIVADEISIAGAP